MITLKEFVDKWLGKKADFDGAYAGQCVDLFRFYLKEVLDITQPKSVVGAADFWSNYETDPNLNQNFTKIKNTPEFVPEKGDVVIWTRRTGSGYGHIAIFLSGDVNKFVSLDQNWPTLSKVTKTEHNYTNVYGVLRPNKQASGEEKIFTEAQMTEVRLERDENHNRAEEWKKKHEDFIQKVSDILGSLVFPDETNIIVNLKTLVGIEDQLKEAKSELVKQEDRHRDEVDKLKEEASKLRVLMEEQERANKTLSDRLTGLEEQLDQKSEEIKKVTWFTKLIDKLQDTFRKD